MCVALLQYGINCVAFAPNNKYIVSVSNVYFILELFLYFKKFKLSKIISFTFTIR